MTFYSHGGEIPCVLNLGLDLSYGSFYDFPTFSEEVKTVTVKQEVKLYQVN